MNRRVLAPDFFARPALAVAKELIGKYLVRRIGERETSVLITETEAYVGPHDLACHGSKGRTVRTEVMFGPPGCWYVYFIYGIHWMLNVVTDGEGYPSAVLIRAAGPWNGPAKLTKALEINKAFNSQSAAPSTDLWIEDRGYRLPRGRLKRTPRIGVDYSGRWAAKPYRFVIDPLPKPAAEIRIRHERDT
ncbi:MAG: DNA-3-methyladenine glycosylase [Planctomycetia bacterium]|nr:DNA-3-methyladenine glycosylase [Planctomycetia bacterium]